MVWAVPEIGKERVLPLKTQLAMRLSVHAFEREALVALMVLFIDAGTCFHRDSMKPRERIPVPWLTLTVALKLATTAIPAENSSAGTPHPSDAPSRPKIIKLGTIDCDLVETTPIVFRGRVYRCEWVRTSYAGNLLKEDYIRLVDRETGEVTAPFGRGYMFASAYVEGGTVYVTGTRKSKEADQIRMFASRDLAHWDEWIVFDQPGFGIFNTSLCKAGKEYVLLFEIDRPADQAGVPFTARFLKSQDLRSWQLTQPECVYAKDRYTAPHCLRYLDGWFYDFYLEAFRGYEMRVVRSRDLAHWDPSPLNPVLRASAEDRKIANPRLTPAQRERIASAVNLNNSDIDFCEYQGRLIINYSWGNQQGIEHLAEAVYEGSEAEFLQAWFPAAEAVPKAH
jgi:hypothetical protein